MKAVSDAGVTMPIGGSFLSSGVGRARPDPERVPWPRLERDFVGRAQWDRYVISFRYAEQSDFLFSIDRGVENYGRSLFVHGQNRYAGSRLIISPDLRWDCSTSGASFRMATSGTQRLADVFEKDFGIAGSH